MKKTKNLMPNVPFIRSTKINAIKNLMDKNC